MIAFIKKIFIRVYPVTLKRKLIVSYTLILLIPTLAIGFLTYKNTQSAIQDQLIQSHYQSLSQIRENLDSKVSTLKNTAASIAFNLKLQNFLLLEFKMLPYTLEHYNQQIMPIVTYALNYTTPDVRGINIYMLNETIPEIWNTFYWESRIKETRWYDDLMKSEQNSIWVYPHRSDHFERRTRVESSPVLTWVQKITASNGRHLGLVTLDIHENVIFSAINTAAEQSIDVLLADSSYNFLYGHDPQIELAKLFDNDHQKERDQYHIIEGGKLYIFQDTDLDNTKLISCTPIGGILSQARTAGIQVLAAFLTGALLLIILMHLVLRIVFGKLHQILNVMDTVADGNFDIRIPVDRKDEMGKLALDFNILIERINSLIKELIARERKQKDAQLMALQYQINPHFIYNTIDTFRMKMELTGNYETACAITDFGKILRYNMSNEYMYTTIKEELNNVDNYINLQKLRFIDRLDYTVLVKGITGNERIIKFILQPIVENSIKYGTVTKDKKIKIFLSIVSTGDFITFTVQDNGPGIPPDKLDDLNNTLKSNEIVNKGTNTDYNIGLFNISQRIRLFYGNEYHVKLVSKEGVFTRTEVTIPGFDKRSLTDV